MAYPRIDVQYWMLAKQREYRNELAGLEGSVEDERVQCCQVLSVISL